MLDRTALQDALVERIFDGLDNKDVYQMVREMIHDEFRHYTDEQLVAEVRENYPDLIEEE